MFDYQNLSMNKRPYIIAEIGSNHNGDINLAKKMIETAKECGADCVKFQSWSKDSIFSNEVYKNNYFLRDDYRNRTDYTLEEIVEEYSVSSEEHHILKNYCDKLGIDFSSTGFSKPEIDLLADELEVPFIKVASMDITNIPLLSYIATKNKPVVISTGLCGLSDINAAIECLEQNGCKQIAILHCVSIYPPRDEEVNLNNIDTYKMLYKYPVGYSDHTLGVTAPIMSISKGVCIIEKHFTLDNNMEGWDHKISANPHQLQQICEAAGTGYKMLGTTEIVVSEDEERRAAFQRSIVAARRITAGEKITIEDIDFKRPGTGISPKDYKIVLGRTASRDIEYDQIIRLKDL
ncbi:N-acetylneuraminate synthase family protein [Luxibacter massiliensis]|uniref:N-acetylneuraminate synthase family protein n=1 Tax=Luxibacter massiliensis TaxID=2219695 RepID=UPI000F067999|nr:N-acetylneuraminate synthase family protein [Luxibacter massiliensis]